MNLSEIKEKFWENFEQLQDQARSFWMGLNQREKVILGVAVSALSIALVAVIFRAVGGLISASIGQGEIMEQAKSIQRHVDELRIRQIQASRYDRMIGERGENFSFEAYVRQKARQYGVEIAELSPKRATSTAAKEEDELFQLRLSSKTSLASGVRFLESVELGLGIRILELQVQPNPENADQILVAATLANNKEL